MVFNIAATERAAKQKSVNDVISNLYKQAQTEKIEMDLVLEPFTRMRYEHLGDTDRECFKRLMECEAQDLFAWLLQRGQPDDEELANIVSQILEFTRTAPADR